MTASIHCLPHARHVTLLQRANLALLVAADAYADVASESRQLRAEMHAQLIAAVARGDMSETIRLAQRVRLADAARSV